MMAAMVVWLIFAMDAWLWCGCGGRLLKKRKCPRSQKGERSVRTKSIGLTLGSLFGFYCTESGLFFHR